MFNGWPYGYMMENRLQHWQYLGRNRLLENEPYAAIFASMATSFGCPPHHPGLWFDQSRPIRKRRNSSQIFDDMLSADYRCLRSYVRFAPQFRPFHLNRK